MSDEARARVWAQVAAAAKRKALAKGPPPSWESLSVLLLLSTVGLGALIASGGLLFGAFSWAVVGARVVPLLALVAAGLFAGRLALRPGSTWAQRWLALASVVLATGVVLAFRGEGHASTSPQWVCSVSHLGAELLPGFIALQVLRAFWPGRLRALLAGATVGLTGVMLGELACERGATHVLLFHVPVLVGVSLAVAWWSSRGPRRSFAP
jgi:hypothetical protein